MSFITGLTTIIQLNTHKNPSLWKKSNGQAYFL